MSKLKTKKVKDGSPTDSILRQTAHYDPAALCFTVPTVLADTDAVPYASVNTWTLEEFVSSLIAEHPDAYLSRDDYDASTAEGRCSIADMVGNVLSHSHACFTLMVDSRSALGQFLLPLLARYLPASTFIGSRY